MDLETITGPTGAKFQVGKKWAPNFMGLLSDLNQRGYAVDGKQSGGYNYRTIDGTKTLSNHAFGKAIDVNWTDNARGKRGTIPEDIARELAAKHGLTWGGGWKNRDDMHFEVANGGPIPMAQRGITSFAGLPSPVANPNVLGPNGGINVAADQTQTSPITTGSVPPQSQSAPMPNQQAQQPQMGLIESLMNPMTMAGLSILADPQRDAARGFAAAGEMSKSMNSRSEQLRAKAIEAQKQQQYQGLLEQLGGQAGPMAPALAQLPPDQGVPLLLKLMEQKQAESQEAEKWGVQRKLIEAQTANTQRQAANGGGETPSNIREWDAFQKMNPDQQRQYLTMKRADKFLDNGNEFVQPNPVVPGQPVQVIPKTLAEAEKQKQIGEAAGKQIAAAPSDVDAADGALALIDDIRKDPNIDVATGFSSYGNVVRGTPGYDFQNKVKQAKSKAFLTALEQLRGMGSLSNAEGDTATAALNRMDTATSKEAFLGALAEYEGIVKKARDKASARLQNQIPQSERRGGYLDKMRVEEMQRPSAPELPPGWSVERVQ